MSTATHQDRLRGRLAIGAVIALGVLGCLAVALELNRRQSLYWYDVRSDYAYDFMTDSHIRVPVTLTQNGFTFPAVDGAWDTALLRLNVKSTLSGAWFEPRVGIGTAKAPACHQRLERRGAGVRYLNLCLTPADIAPDAMVMLDRSHVRWPDQEAELLLFRGADPDAMRLLVLAPHADDAEIAAFGLYARRDSWVVTITNGSYGGAMYRGLSTGEPALDSLQAELRVWDSMVVPIWGGLSPDRATNLGYFTLQLEAMKGAPGRAVPHRLNGATSVGQWRRTYLPFLSDRPVVASWDNLVGDLVALLEGIEPDIVVLPHPALDANRDHVYTTAAFLEALERLGDPPMELLLYTNHHALSEFHPFGPADAAVTLPPWLDPSVRFRSVYSHPLDAATMVAKLFALDAMHDLRSPPSAVGAGPVGELMRRMRGGIGDLYRDPSRELSYFRRGVRPNELFFRYSSEDRGLLQGMVPPAQVAAMGEGAAPPR